MNAPLPHPQGEPAPASGGGAAPHAAAPPGLSRRTLLLLAFACGATVGNLYYAQPLAAEIAASLGIAPAAAGLVVTMTQLGYAAGLFFLVPLGDLIENRRLIAACSVLSAAALAASALAPNAHAFFLASAAVGLLSVSVQMIVPLAAHLAPDATRGRVVGTVTSGLMIGILAARPVASFLASMTSWRAVFGVSSVLMLALAALLSRTLPRRAPEARMSYPALIGSMARIAAETPVLRLRAFYQMCLFGAFSVFWTTSPLLLLGPDYGFSQKGVALFALVGVSGAVAAPLAGRLADRGLSGAGTCGSILLVGFGFLLTLMAPQGSLAALAALAAAAVLIDFGVQSNLVFGYRAIFNMAPDSRARLNAAYLASFFLTGAAGSALGGWAFAHYGWKAAAAIGLSLAGLALLRFLFRLIAGRV